MPTPDGRDRDTTSLAAQASRLSTLLMATGLALVLWGAVRTADALWPAYGLQVAGYTTPASWDGRVAHRQLDTTLSNELIGSAPFSTWRTFSIEWTGALAITDESDYTFSLTSDDGSTLEIDGALVVDNGGTHTRRRITGQRHLAPGVYPMRVRYFQAGERSTFTLLWTRSGEGLAPIPPHQLLPVPMSPTAYRLRHVAPLAAALAVMALGVLVLRRLRSAALAAGVRFTTAARMLDGLGHPLVAIAVVLAAGFLVRAALTTMPAILWSDSDLFYITMREIVGGQWTSHDAFRTLIYPQLLAVVLGGRETPAAGAAVVVVQHALGLLSAVLFYQVSRRASSAHVALVAALAFVVHPVQLFYELSILTEALFTCSLAVALWCTVRAQESPAPSRAALSGVATAMMVLVRPVAQYFIAWPMAVVAVAARPWRRGAALAAVVLLCYALPIVPLMQLNQREFGFFGVSLGQGLGLYTRVFQIDELVPPATSRYPEMRGLWDYARSEAWSPNRVHDELNYQRDYTAATADAAMYAFARETVLAHPVRFGVTTAWRWVVQAVAPMSGIHACDSSHGTYLCSGRMEGESLPPFPNAPAAPSALREAAVTYVLHGGLDMRVVVLLAVAGFLVMLRPGERSPAGLLLAATIAYVVLVPAASQFPQDRYRLPVDALFFLFAARGAVWGAERLLAPARE